MKKLLVTILAVSLLFVGLSINSNHSEYRVTGEVREFIICQNTDKEGFFLEKTEKTSHLKKGDTVEITTDENNQIINVMKK